MKKPYDSIRPIQWREDTLFLQDQRVLPTSEKWLRIESCAQASQAITEMVVRGAPAIGITAAYAAVLSARDRFAETSEDGLAAFKNDMADLKQARPTAVNLAWAVETMSECVRQISPPVTSDDISTLLAKARTLHQQDITANYRIGELGAALLPQNCTVLTHCNAGALATGGYGTALGVIRAAMDVGKLESVLANETRPWLQGARLTAYELIKEGIPMRLIADSSAAHFMAQGVIDAIVVGADRVAANGDVANKIGTYALSVLAKAHNILFVVAAPTTSIDLHTVSGDLIPLESRSGDELLTLAGAQIALSETLTHNPVFDVTPARNIDYLVTEKGVIEHPNTQSVCHHF